MDLSSTIAGIATPIGVSATGVIRVSGDGALTICDAVIKGKKPSDMPANTTAWARCVDANSGQVIDEVVVAVFRAPKSFTGQDTVELSCHGSPYVLQRVMLALLEAGARQAGPGEFTKRAFLNGKMDLAMAEAVGDLIQAQSEAAHRVALNQMRGGVSKKLAYLRQQLVDLAALLELELDFGEEDVAFANRDTLKQILTDIRQEIDGLIGSFITGKMIKEGVQVVIVGKPNAGKSTLLNALVQEEKAIVTAQEGTTRDLIEEVAEIIGVLFRFFDTAGLRQGTDEVELIGIQRAKDKMLQADLVIYLFDATVTTAEMLDKELMQIPRDKRVLVVGNKIDLVTTDGDLPGRTGLVYISAKGKLHMDKLEKALVEAVGLDGYAQETMITSVRHTQALIEARKALEEVLLGLEGLVSSELLVQDLRIVMDAIGSITGEISPNEVLGAVFSRFCIGK